MRNIRLVSQILFLTSLAASLTTCAGAVALNGIVISPANTSIPAGATQQFTALGWFNDGSTSDVTGEVTWTSSNTAVAAIGSTGLAIGVGPGITTITAKSSLASSYSTTGSQGSTILTVYSATLSSISVTPANSSVPVGVAKQLAATGTYSDGTSFDITPLVTWSSSNTAVTTVGSTGLATVLAAGTATITANSGSTSGSTTVTGNSATLSSISVTPANPSIPVGVTLQFTATGAYSDGTSFDITPLVTWASSDPAVAAVGSTGLAASVAAGAVTITAASGSTSGSTTLTMNSATLSSISITPADPSIPSIPAGVTKQFTATGIYSDGSSFDITPLVTWASSATTLATVGSTGLATGLAAGVVTITATSGSISGSTTLTMTSATLTSISVILVNPLITVGAHLQQRAIGAYSDGTSYDITALVAWSSSNTAVATVGSAGLVTGAAPGTTTIKATAGVVSGNTTITVTSG